MKAKWMAVVFTATALLAAGLFIPAMGAGQEPDLPDLELPELDEASPPGRPGPRPGGMMRPDRPGPGGGPGMHAPMSPHRQMMLNRIKEEDPERHARILKIRELAEEYRGSDDTKRRAEIERELRPLVDAELKKQQEDARKKVEEMEKKLEHFKEILEKREKNWDEVVDHNVKKITGEADYLDFPLMPRRR